MDLLQNNPCGDWIDTCFKHRIRLSHVHAHTKKKKKKIYIYIIITIDCVINYSTGPRGQKVENKMLWLALLIVSNEYENFR